MRTVPDYDPFCGDARRVADHRTCFGTDQRPTPLASDLHRTIIAQVATITPRCGTTDQADVRHAIDPQVDAYVLLGRVVTMTDQPPPIGVIDEGAVYIHDGTIHAVLAANDPAPAGFGDAAKVRVGGTIYPGLIELHNHLSYNALPLWQVPRQYMHSGHWQGTDEYRANVTKPAMVLANTAGNAEALVRFVECKCLLGGVTTSQGITLQANSGIRSLYAGLVRNVEAPLNPVLPGAKARIGAPDRDLDAYVGKLIAAPHCYLQHLSEGINDGTFDTALKQFTGLLRQDGTWALHHSLCGVHSTALLRQHFDVLAAHGGSIVWSPLSNYLLYGETTDVKAAKEAGVPIALGSDWAPSGTRNLLGEVKVAAIVSEELGDLFSARELCHMMTTTPAQILGWRDKLGTIEAGKLADLIVIDDTTDEPFEQLVAARETSLTLVVIDGIPRVGQPRLMKKFGAGAGEVVSVGRAKRILDLRTRPGDLDLGVTFAEAQAKLADTLENLPARAADLDAAIAVGWTPGLELAASGLSEELMPAGWQEPRLRVVLEFEEEAGEAAFLATLRAGDLADWVSPMRLEGPTVPDDPGFLRNLMKAVNLPRFIKEKLPSRHGFEFPIPDPSTQSGQAHGLVADPSQSVELRSYLDRDEHAGLDVTSRARIVEQAILLLERYYVHLPMKRTMHAVDPVQRLRNLNHDMENGRGAWMSDLDFHREMIDIFDSLRDLHTCYRLPRPFRGKIAWLPYLIEECDDQGVPRFVVSKLVGDPANGSLPPDVEVLYWNGIPIERYVAMLARRTPGGNAAARRARAINSLTLRSLTRGQIPDEDWVTLTYRTADGTLHDHHQPWLVFEPRVGHRTLSPENFGVVQAAGLGIDDQTDDLQQAKKNLFAASQMEEEERLQSGGGLRLADSDHIPSTLPTIFRAGHVRHGRRKYGYLRIFSFNVNDADLFVDEFERLLGEFSVNGLIIDIRGNGGGLIHAAERALELLSPVSIAPEPAQFINTPATLRLCRDHSESARLRGLTLRPWLGSMERSAASGATHSLGFPITRPEDCNLRGQKYQGPKVLIVDGLCYSAADMFAAGFKDHDIGTIVGIHGNTGAGGANVWSHRLLQFLSTEEPDHGGFRLLPQGADLRAAVRRTLRVRATAGELVEDFGIEPDVRYAMTRDDLLNGNRSLIEAVLAELKKLRRYWISVQHTGDHFRLKSPGSQFVQVTATGRPVGTFPLDGNGEAHPRIRGPLGAELEFVAIANGRPVARTRHAI